VRNTRQPKHVREDRIRVKIVTEHGQVELFLDVVQDSGRIDDAGFLKHGKILGHHVPTTAAQSRYISGVNKDA